MIQESLHSTPTTSVLSGSTWRVLSYILTAMCIQHWASGRFIALTACSRFVRRRSKYYCRLSPLCPQPQTIPLGKPSPQPHQIRNFFLTYQRASSSAHVLSLPPTPSRSKNRNQSLPTQFPLLVSFSIEKTSSFGFCFFNALGESPRTQAPISSPCKGDVLEWLFA